MKTFHVSFAQKRHLLAIAKLLWKEIYDDIPFDRVYKWIANAYWPPNEFNQWFVLTLNTTIIGAICWSIYDQYGSKVILNISWLAITEEYQGQGFGKKLWDESFQQVCQGLKERGLKASLVIVQVDEENVKALRYFRKRLRNPTEVFVPNVWSGQNGVYFLFKKIGKGFCKRMTDDKNTSLDR